MLEPRDLMKSVFGRRSYRQGISGSTGSHEHCRAPDVEDSVVPVNAAPELRT